MSNRSRPRTRKPSAGRSMLAARLSSDPATLEYCLGEADRHMAALAEQDAAEIKDCQQKEARTAR